MRLFPRVKVVVRGVPVPHPVIPAPNNYGCHERTTNSWLIDLATGSATLDVTDCSSIRYNSILKKLHIYLFIEFDRVKAAFVVGRGPERIKILALTRPNFFSCELGPWALFSWVDPPIIIDRCRNPRRRREGRQQTGPRSATSISSTTRTPQAARERGPFSSHA